MGTTINGAVGRNAQTTMNGMLTVKNTTSPQARMSALRTGGTDSKKKKPLNYNHREISGQILRAKKPQNAANVLTRAKSKLAVLQRQAGTGQYDTKEITNALAHARRMVRCAQMKVRNLKEEEQDLKAHRREGDAKEHQIKNETKRWASQKEQELRQKIAMKEIQEIAKEKRKCTELTQKKRMHRNQERSRINEADMKYIKGMTENSTGDTSAVLDLSMEAAALSELQLTQQQLEAQVEAEIEAEMSLSDMGSGSVETTQISADTGVASPDMAIGGTVDISI